MYGFSLRIMMALFGLIAFSSCVTPKKQAASGSSDSYSQGVLIEGVPSSYRQSSDEQQVRNAFNAYRN